MKNAYFIFLFLIVLIPINTQAQMLDHILGDLLVQLPEKASPDQLIRDLQYFNGKPTGLMVVRKLRTQRNIWLLNFDQNQIHEIHFLNHIRNLRSVELAQFNHLLTERQTVPNDPQFFQQWHWVNNGAGGGTFDADVDADLVWDLTTGGTTAQGDEIVVCVMEGANRNHEDLQGNLWFNLNEIPGDGVDNDNNGYTDDIGGWNNAQNDGDIPTSGHGTAVSGMIGAVGNNSLGVTGINWNVKIMHVNVGSLDDANVMEAYNYPLVMRRKYNQTGGTEGAFVVATNASWGIDGGQPADAPLWCNVYDELGAEGVLNCGATANVNWDIDVVGDLPTACPSDFMVSVTATDDSDLRTFSAYGLINVDLGAPGSNVYTLSGNGYNYTSGTSFASPLTAGIIALLYSAPCSSIAEQALSDPQGTALLIRDYLYNGVDQTPQLLLETVSGGRANAFNSLQLLLQNCGTCFTPYSLNAANIIDTSATLTWYEADSVLYSDLRYRIVGNPDWSLINNVSSPYELTTLQGCSDYEFQVQGICSDSITGFSSSYFFSTEGCCFAPQNVTIDPVSMDEIIISWDSAFAVLGYIVNYKDANAPEWSTVTVNTSTISIDDLNLCTEYEFELATICSPDSTSDFTEIFYYVTDCPCEIPLNIDTIDVTMEDATIFWSAADNADSYLVRLRRFGLIDWKLYQTTQLSLTFDSLDACTNYQFQIQTVCPIDSSNFSTSTIFKTDCAVGIDEIDGISELMVYPNPVVDELLIEFNLLEQQDIAVHIFNTTGQMVASKEFENRTPGYNQLVLTDLNHLAQGIYFVKINLGSQFVLKKIIKK